MTTTTLDRDLEWLKGAAGVDDEYLARWDRAVWAEWSRAMHADRNRNCPSVPGWMAELMPHWYADFSLPFPCVAQLWPTLEDWFDEGDGHDDITLIVQEPGEGYAPKLEQVRTAWEYAAARGVTPALAISVVPDEPIRGTVTAEIEAFYITNVSREVDDVAAEIRKILGAPGGRPVLDLDGLGDALAWEWMYG